MRKPAKKRLDDILLIKELVETKPEAQAFIIAGQVSVDGKLVLKPGTFISQDAIIKVREKLPYVSRGGIKLAYALDEFKTDVSGMKVIDVGASTGGFTDCFLQRGVKKVYAIDVGYGQLEYKLRQDPRVAVMDRTNAHYPFQLPEKVDLAAIDVSFISVTRVIPNALEHLKPGGYILVLLKPQFEAERGEVGRGGIIRDHRIHTEVLARFFKWAIVENGLNLRGLIASPILGAEGNKEFLILLKTV